MEILSLVIMGFSGFIVGALFTLAVGIYMVRSF